MPKGILTLAQLENAVETGKVDTIVTVFTDLYGRLLGKRLTPNYFFDKIKTGIAACNYLLAVDMEMQPVDAIQSANWAKGFGDFLLLPDLNTLRIASWMEKTAIVICDVIDEKTKELIPIAPRSLLKKQLVCLQKAGYQAKAASELEYYLFDEDYRTARECSYQGLTPSSWYSEDYHILQTSREENLNALARYHLEESGIPVENTKGEFGIGQHELNIYYSELLEMADRHCLMKQCLKEFADQQGLSITFMAKPNKQQAGSSCHLHLSLWQNEQSAFAGTESLSNFTCSTTFKQFLAGWIHYTPELLPFLAPTVNSYKRFEYGSWAPTNTHWSHDNRTAGFRIVGHDQALRIECRLPGADINPYLAYTAALAAGLAGINEQLTLPAEFTGNAYDSEQVSLATNLQLATEQLSISKLARTAFGDEVTTDLLAFFRNEWRAYEEYVSDWELIRYFERI